jgi:BirA family transcriptional regulator, biotin operon repressor / biotin---[acetyl-CoA-carboxylase] ligase
VPAAPPVRRPDPERPALDGRLLADALEEGPWELVLVPSTDSTNLDVARMAAAGAEHGLVLAAEYQRSGRGRLDRTWSSPPRAGLTFSVLLRPAAEPARWSWLPLLAGLAVAEALSAPPGVDVALKWPNDLLVGDGKVGGILAERTGDAVVIGIGVNVTTSAAELPVATATSLALAGSADLDRTSLLVRILTRLAFRYEAWNTPSGDPGLRGAYASSCSTIGREVRVELSAGAPPTVTGLATGIDDEGRLLVAVGSESRAVAAGDVVHLG